MGSSGKVLICSWCWATWLTHSEASVCCDYDCYFRSRVNSTGVGVAVGFGILAILFTIGIVQFCVKYRCKKCKKCCKKKKPSLKDQVLTKVGMKKSPPPFSISGTLK